MAEISVPAWPIPTHQTKFVMSQAHMVGPRRPQMPRPLVKSSPTASRKISSSPMATAKVPITT